MSLYSTAERPLTASWLVVASMLVCAPGRNHESIQQEDVLTRVFSEAGSDPHYSTVLQDVFIKIEENASTITEAIDWLVSNELWVNKRILEEKVKKFQGLVPEFMEYAKTSPKGANILIEANEEHLDECKERLEAIEIKLIKH